MLEIIDLHASSNNVKILKGVNLTIKYGEIHAIMGTNGSGKSTLSKIIAGHPNYKITHGNIIFKGEDITNCEPEYRSHKGIFLGFQYPIEIDGVSNEDFLRLAYNAKQKALGFNQIDPIEFSQILKNKMDLVKMDETLISRNVNEGFSGGEKKRNEIFQFALLDSIFGILDETDSGLDIDALKLVSEAINNLMNATKSIILITHYKRLLEYIKPNYIHVMQNGKIIKTGDSNLAQQLEEKGYEWLIQS
uniref:Ycf16 n=1 Tax=Schizocladia ischiensis TaxID=196139 RepID=A0A7S6UA23_9STRA|nr:Ycf16 [Schizocladia ischiensis]QOW07585.1 Ycf16 [Schizocladia ischiensis]